MPLLFELPTDILLEIVKVLELPDPLSLVITCSFLYRLSNERSFWISVLETTRRRAPIACSGYADLSQYDLEALKGLVVSWMKLQSNWDQPSPQIIQPVVSARLPEPAQFIFLVQGTDILVLTMGGNVLCWDARLAAPFSFPAIETGGRITRVSGPSESPGTCSLAILAEKATNPPTAHRYVITIQHHNGKATSFTSQSWSMFIPHGRYFESLVLTEDMVATIVAMQNREDCIVTAGAINGDTRAVDSTSILKLHRPVSTQDLTVTFAYRGHLYALLEDSVSVSIHHISRKTLQSGHCEQTRLYSCPIPRSHMNSAPFCYMIPSSPSYGIGAVFTRLVWDDDDGNSIFTSFTFMPNTLTHEPDDGVSSPLAFDSPCVTEHVRGELAHLGLVWLDHSGFNVIAAIRPANFTERWALVLVRYHPETSSSSVHSLSLPETIDITEIDSLCIDDAAGAVYLVDRAGIFSTLRYV
ncbi:F-box domain-containing protein [Mycena sanguinolenta]|uniref:F-box domain-containing protein n=1 Tax=Mycena sanguinolenta TaxID=230812 RepID=A0A8H6XZ04_9AGAR|nr:F-box domain-containing protein [Mycena sanguinolenta]